jgi:hypothetical protein
MEAKVADESKSTRTSNKYDRPNKYEEAEPAGTTPARQGSSASASAGMTENWPVRSNPGAPSYQPALGETGRGRRRAEKLRGDLSTAALVADAGSAFNQALTRLEDSAQRLEEVQERRRLIPLKIEKEKFEIGKAVIDARSDFEGALDQQEEKRIDQHRRRQLDAEDFEIVRLEKQAARLELEARIAAANAEAVYSGDIGRRKAQAELHKAEGEALRQEADAARQRQHRDQASTPPGDTDDVPPDLRAPLATARKVARTREWVDRKIAEIKLRAETERRQLTPEDFERIDQLNDAAANGEASIRRSGASDVA